MAATAPRPRGSGRRPRSPRPPRAEERRGARSNGATWTLKNRGVHADCEQGTNRKEMKEMKGMKGIFGIKEMSFESWRFDFCFIFLNASSNLENLRYLCSSSQQRSCEASGKCHFN